eukprot:m.485011 g.485011  ORF g.485011 m.485011 type:complete len:206 (-) comp23631_c0_seq1:9-626(-)
MSEAEFCEACDEPAHKTVLLNDTVRIIRVQFPPKHVTLFHRHQLDSFYIHLKTAHLRNDVVGKDAAELSLNFGGCAYGAHESAPFVHQITGLDDIGWDCIDGELLAKPPSVAPAALLHDDYEQILSGERVRMYKVSVAGGASVGPVNHEFYSVVTMLADGNVEGSLAPDGAKSFSVGECAWVAPGPFTLKNNGTEPFVVYITELL